MNGKAALTLDDVCLIPPKSYIRSRTAPDISTYISTNVPAKIPIINSPMDSVISVKLGNILGSYGTPVIFHRQLDYNLIVSFKYPFFVSTGVLPDINKIVELQEKNSNLVGINVDVANGHSVVALEAVENLKKKFPDLEIMGGAICTDIGYKDMVSAGASSVRVNIGNGSACTTRLVTGFGLPQFSALASVAAAAAESNWLVPFISDGGIRTSGDIVKCLAAGASAVMIGNLFAQTNESAAQKRTNSYQVRECLYRGQASKDYQEDHYGSVRILPEGESAWIPVVGPAHKVIDQLCAGIKTGLAWGDAANLRELREKARFAEVTSNYIEESRPRIL